MHPERAWRKPAVAQGRGRGVFLLRKRGQPVQRRKPRGFAILQVLQNAFGAFLQRSQHRPHLCLPRDLLPKAADQIERLGLGGARLAAQRFEGFHVERHGLRQPSEPLLIRVFPHQKARLVGQVHYVVDAVGIRVAHRGIHLGEPLVGRDVVAECR